MVWPCQSTPASKLYVDGKLCLKGPEGFVMEMAHVFQDTAKGYQLWIKHLATLCNLRAWGSRAICEFLECIMIVEIKVT